MNNNPYMVLEKVEEGMYKSIFVACLAEAFRKCIESPNRSIVKKIEVAVVEKYDK